MDRTDTDGSGSTSGSPLDERRGGEWRIVHRTVVKDFIELRPLTEADEPEYAIARPDRTDPVYHQR